MRGGSTRHEKNLSWRHRSGDRDRLLAHIKHGLEEEVAVSNDLDTGDTKPTPMSVDKKSAHVEEKNQNSRDGKMKGLLLLTTVPLVWGTYAPSVKYLYEWRGDSILSPPGLVFNFACYSVSALTLAGVFWFDHLRRRWANKGKVFTPKATAQTNRYAARAGLELGGWLFLGSTLQVWGLELTSASRASFLIQLTTVIVPVLEALLGRRELKAQLWIACMLATVGVSLVSLGGVLSPGIVGIPSTEHVMESVTAGDAQASLLLVLAAIFYSLHVVRLGVHVSRLETLELARAKSIAEVMYSTIALVLAAVIGGQGEIFSRFVSSLVAHPGYLLAFAAATIWNGAITTAYGMWAQTRGQASVAPSEANLVYSMQPLWSTLFAVVFLKEVFGTTESAGAALVLFALFLATRDGQSAASRDAVEVKVMAREQDVGDSIG